MISFATEGAQFNYRVVAVCVHDGHVLLHRAERDDFWSLPGGRVEAMEESRRALERELGEELGHRAEVGRLLWVVENFFTTPAGTRCHEVALFYEVDLSAHPELLAKGRAHRGVEGSLSLIFEWFPLDALRDLRLYPTLLRDALRELPETVGHVVHWDEDQTVDEAS